MGFKTCHIILPGELETDPDTQEGVDGDVEAGDYVKTLHRRQALYANVLSVDRKRRATIEGRTQAGRPLQRDRTSVENLELLSKGDGAARVAAEA